ncbi:MAG: 2Fe-2S iron-sulfur cluster-binding protein [Thermoanaerobaculia bacterium]
MPLGRSAETRADETVLDAARRAGAPLGNSCGAVGVCARCRVQIADGATNLSAPTNIELRTASSRGFADGERLACQTVVMGDCSVTTTYW